MPEGEDIQVFSSEEFTHDPVMFGALMDFQYGSGDESEDAGNLLEKASRGIACKNLSELALALNDFEFWVNLGQEPRAEPRRYRLYMNGEEPSLYAAALLQMAGCSFEVMPLEQGAVRISSEQNMPLPVVVDLRHGIPHSLEGIKGLCRNFLISKEINDESEEDFYQPGREEFRCGYLKIKCVDEERELVFHGAIESAPYPVAEMLKGSRYVQRTSLTAFNDVLVWRIGEWDSLRADVGASGCFVNQSPPAVLLPDEVRAFDEGGGPVVAYEYGFMYGVTYDAYFLIEGYLYRIYAMMTD